MPVVVSLKVVDGSAAGSPRYMAWAGSCARSDSSVELPSALASSHGLKLGCSPPTPPPAPPLPGALHPSSQVHPCSPMYVAWAGSCARSDSSVDVPSALAASLGLKPGCSVQLEVVGNHLVSEAVSVEVEPLTPSDWEVLELNAGLLEDQLLSQVAIAVPNQPFAVWVRNQSVIHLRTVSCTPSTIVRLVAGSELHVAPKPRQMSKKPDKKAANSAAQHNGGGQQIGRSMQDLVSSTSASSYIALRVLAMPRRLFCMKFSDLGSGTGDIAPSSEAAGSRAGGPDSSAPDGKGGNGFGAVAAPTEATQVFPEASKAASWLTTAVVLNPETAALHGLTAGGVVLLIGSTAGSRSASTPEPDASSASSSAVLPAMISRVPVVVVTEKLCPPGHALIAPPLMEAMGLEEHTMASLLPCWAPGSTSHNAVHPVPLATLPGVSLHPLVPASLEPSDNSHLTQATTGTTADKALVNALVASCTQGADVGSTTDGALIKSALGAALLSWWQLQLATLSRLTLECRPHTSCNRHSSKRPEAPPASASSKRLEGDALPSIQLADGDRKEESLPSRQLTDGGQPCGCSEYDSTFLPLLSGMVMHLSLGTQNHSISKEASVQTRIGSPLQAPTTQLSSSNPTIQQYLHPITHGAQAKPGQPNQPPLSKATIDEVAWLRPQLEICLKRALPNLDPNLCSQANRFGVPRGGGLLLTGAPGNGRTLVLSVLLDLLSKHPSLRCHCVHVSCATLLGSGHVAGEKPINAFTKASQAISEIVNEALACAPAVIAFDDLDLLVPSSPAGGAHDAEQQSEQAQDPETAARLAEWISDVMTHYRLSSSTSHGPPPLLWVAVAKDAPALHASLCQAGGFDAAVRLPAPGAPGRVAMLASGLKSRGVIITPKQVDSLASKAEGCNAGDMSVLLERAVHAAVARRLREPVQAGGTGSASSQVILLDEDLESALGNGFVPSAFWGVAAAAGDSAGGLEGWEDVGGLSEARAALVEALMLPIRHAALASSAPLRLRTGLLLFGPPGCGKTHLVGAAVAAVAKMAKMRFISVKGPELLNKYIGASEAAVRELFQRAQSAAPCVVFFDELDAIAPPRGHDSTGVTDRVVNQLLTELDGVEGLKGVSVLAATSRPDLVDAALLRPGRLDRLVYCGVPDSTERLSILKALSRKMALTEDVDLSKLVDGSEGLTAQLMAVHEVLDAQMASKDSTSQQTPSGPAGVLAIPVPASAPVPLADSSSPRDAEQPHSLDGISGPTLGADLAPGTAGGTLGAELALGTARGTLSADLAPGTSHTHPQAEKSNLNLNSNPQAGKSNSNSNSNSNPQAEAQETAVLQAPVISMAHLEHATRVARPSLPVSERKRLEAIYQQFRLARETKHVSAEEEEEEEEEAARKGKAPMRATMA
eukprot:gene3773-13838_t